MFAFNQNSGYLVDNYLEGEYRNKFTDIDRMIIVCQAMNQAFYINYLIIPQVVCIYTYMKQRNWDLENFKLA